MSDNNNTDVMKIKGKLMYPKLFSPDTMYEPKYTLDLLLDAEGLKEAKAAALRIQKERKNKDGDKVIPYANLFDGYDGSYLRIEKTVKDRDGKDRERPQVKDVTGLRDVPSSTRIGNGTDSKVRFMIKKRDAKGTELSPAEAMKKSGGYGMFLFGVQIINLVPYEAKNGSGSNFNPDSDFVEESGSFKVEGDAGFEFEKTENPFDDSNHTILSGG